MEDLRNHLFEALEALKDKDEPMDVNRALAVAAVSNAIINSAKLELRFLELKGQEAESEFLTPQLKALPPAAPTKVKALAAAVSREPASSGNGNHTPVGGKSKVAPSQIDEDEND